MGVEDFVDNLASFAADCDSLVADRGEVLDAYEVEDCLSPGAEVEQRDLLWVLLHFRVGRRSVPASGVQNAVSKGHRDDPRLVKAGAEEMADEAGAVVAVADRDV